jgi:hypothetical protein
LIKQGRKCTNDNIEILKKELEEHGIDHANIPIK